MAGCFGNHPFDKHMEGELNKHLNQEQEYENFCDSIFDECLKIDIALADSADFGMFWDEGQCSAILVNNFFRRNDSDCNSVSNIANYILDEFIKTAK